MFGDTKVKLFTNVYLSQKLCNPDCRARVTVCWTGGWKTSCCKRYCPKGKENDHLLWYDKSLCCSVVVFFSNLLQFLERTHWMTVCDAMTTIAEFSMAIEYNDRNNDDDDNDCNNNNNCIHYKVLSNSFMGRKTLTKNFPLP